jgi:hypothetical protein
MMTNEFKHASVGSDLSQDEWEAVSTHIADGQTAGDILYFDGTYWKRRPYNVGARVYNSANETIPTTTWATVTFNSERWDTDNIHDNSTNNSRLTCKTAGIYLIVFCGAFASATSGRLGGEIVLNGTTQIGMMTNLLSSLGQMRTNITAIYSLNVNDYVEALVLQESGGNLDLVAAANYSPEFMMQRIG